MNDVSKCINFNFKLKISIISIHESCCSVLYLLIEFICRVSTLHYLVQANLESGVRMGIIRGFICRHIKKQTCKRVIHGD